MVVRAKSAGSEQGNRSVGPDFGVIEGGRGASLMRRGGGEVQGSLLVTGATGFVGGELLLRLLARDDQSLICLVRAGSTAEAEERGHVRLSSLLGRTPTSEEAARVRWVRADLEQPSLGVAPLAWKQIARSIREIYHCAASVDFDLPLEEAHRINVGGVEALLSLAREAGTRFKRFHHVSTAYVAGYATRRVSANYLPSDRASNFRNAYERTKARAERLLRDQVAVPVTIYRPSIIGGDTDTGRTDNWNVIYVPMRQMAKGRLPIISRGGKAIVDTVGVDFVVDGMLALADRSDTRLQAYHLTADHLAFELDRYVRICNRGIRARGGAGTTRAVGRTVWKCSSLALRALTWAPPGLGRLRKIGKAASAGLKSFETYLAYTSVDVAFAADEEHRVLAAAGIRMPDPDIYLERIVDYALTHDFGRASRTEADTRTVPACGKPKNAATSSGVDSPSDKSTALPGAQAREFVTAGGLS